MTKALPACCLTAVVFAAGARADDAISTPDSSSFLSRVTIAVPLLTHHFPHDEDFNDANWGAFVDVAMTKHWSFVAGDFRNSYRRNTAFAGVGWYPLNFDVSRLAIDLGGVIAADLNGGYKPYNSVDPLLGALSMKIHSAHVEERGLGLLERMGVAFTVIPAASTKGATAVNLALTFRL